MRPVLAVLFLLASGVSASHAEDSIVFWSDDGDYALCHLDIPPGETRTWHIVAQRDALAGIGGAEFRVAGFPAGYSHVVTSNPAANVHLGGPLQGGCNIAFPSTCETASSLLLYTVETTNLGNGQGGAFSIEQHSIPTNVNIACSQLNHQCFPPSATFACVPGATAYVNQGSGTPPADPVPADGATDIAANAQLSWSVGHPGSECAVGVPSHRVYFGTDSDPPFVGELSPLENTVFDPGALQADTTYYWRIEALDTGFGISGPVWSFTTTDVVAAEALTWSEAKQLYHRP